MDDPELLWTGILSRDPGRIHETWELLNADEKASVHAHLVAMATETGWTAPQRVSAQFALDALEQRNDPPSSSDPPSPELI